MLDRVSAKYKTLYGLCSVATENVTIPTKRLRDLIEDITRAEERIAELHARVKFLEEDLEKDWEGYDPFDDR